LPYYCNTIILGIPRVVKALGTSFSVIPLLCNSQTAHPDQPDETDGTDQLDGIDRTDGIDEIDQTDGIDGTDQIDGTDRTDGY